MRKLIFFDIDGTLLTQGANRYIPDSVPVTLRRLQANGHLCFINTGRSRAEIGDELLSLGMDGLVCGCGTYINYHDEVLFARHLPQTLADAVVQDLQDYGLEWMLEGKEHIYYSNVPYTTHIGDFHKEYHTLYPNASADIAPGTPGLDFDKFCICLPARHHFDAFREKYKDIFTFIDRGQGFYEVMPQGCSKASGIRFLMEHFSVSREDTIAIGDSTNDLPMLTYAGLSIAMKESDDIVLKQAGYITDTVENDGIQKAMEHFSLI